MGACKSKDKKSHHTHEKTNIVKAEVPPTTRVVNQPVNGVVESQTITAVKQVPVREIISPEQQQQKMTQYKIKFLLGDRVLHEGEFPGEQPLSVLHNELRLKLGGSDYDYYLVDTANNSKVDITRRGSESLKTIFSNEVNTIELSYAGLDISPNIRRAYEETSGIIATPKFDASNFEIISFNKSTSGVAYQIYQDESFDYLKTFNEFSGYCNGNNKLFISGSDKKNEDETYNNIFIEIDLNNLNKPDHLRKLPNLLTGRGWHSMIFVPPRYVFIVGGINTKSVELYNIEKNQITHDSNLVENRSEASLCCVNNMYLYAFCGFLLNNNFHTTIERCNLKARTRQWEIVNLITEQGCIFEPSFFSVAYGKGDSIILLGGNENSRTAAKNYVFDEKDGSSVIANYKVNPVEDFYLCSEKFFLPVDEKTSILMPVYTSEVVKVLMFDSDAAILSLIKFEAMETAEDDIRNSLTYQHNEKLGEVNPLQRIHEEKIKAESVEEKKDYI
jgi:hypothetical protein